MLISIITNNYQIFKLIFLLNNMKNDNYANNQFYNYSTPIIKNTSVCNPSVTNTAF
jgi:hypothetical protein